MNKLLRSSAILLSLLLLVACEHDNTGKDIACTPSGLSTYLIALYPFSNGSLQDISGNNRHLALVGAATPATDREGNAQCAYAFDNRNATAYLIKSDPVFLNNLEECSISLWYMITDSLTSGTNHYTLVSRDSTRSCPDRSGQWSLGLFDCSRAVFATSNSVWDKMVTQPFTSCQDEINARYNSWHHAVATYKRSTKTISLYRDGILQGTKTGDAICGGGSVPVLQDIGDLFLGHRFTGRLDDVALFSKVLNQQEVQALYNNTACCSAYVE